MTDNIDITTEEKDQFYKAGFLNGKEKRLLKQEKRTNLITIWMVIGGIVIIESFALYKGINGKALMVSLVVLGGVGGAGVQKFVNKFLTK